MAYVVMFLLFIFFAFHSEYYGDYAKIIDNFLPNSSEAIFKVVSILVIIWIEVQLLNGFRYLLNNLPHPCPNIWG